MTRSLENLIPSAEDFLKSHITEVVRPKLLDAYNNSIPTTRKDGTFEPTSNLDKIVDAKIREAWERYFPYIPMLSEDSSSDRRIKGKKPEELLKLPALLIVDPIDGSGNLPDGSGWFSTSCGLSLYGKPSLAIVYQASTDTFWTAETGKEGAFENDMQIHVSERKKLDEARASTALAWNLKKRKASQRVFNRVAPFISQLITRASSVLDITQIARGNSEAHLSIGLKPWDTAACSLIVVHAGGRVTKLNGEEWNPFEPDILASNEHVHDKLLTIINRGLIVSALVEKFHEETRRDVKPKKIVVFVSKKGHPVG